MASLYLGKGVAFPFRTDLQTGDIAGASGKENVRNSIRMFLSTCLMELDLAEGYGIRRLLFENIDPGTMDVINNNIREGLARYEPRIVVLDVSPRRVLSNGMVGIATSIRYRIRSTGQEDELTYLPPEE